MNRKMLKYIKNDMWDVLYNKKYLQASLKQKLKELESERKFELAEMEREYGDSESLWYFRALKNEAFDRRRIRIIEEEYSMYHNDQSYYLIYKDGSEVIITAEDILGGEKFPKMSDIVYAELLSADDHFDTERGELDWYSEEALQACDYDYDVEDERKWQYETAVQFKFDTEWSRTYRQKNPEFIPEKL